LKSPTAQMSLAETTATPSSSRKFVPALGLETTFQLGGHWVGVDVGVLVVVGVPVDVNVCVTVGVSVAVSVTVGVLPHTRCVKIISTPPVVVPAVQVACVNRPRAVDCTPMVAER